MKEAIKITLVLTIVCLVCALALSVVHGSAKDKIAKNAAAMVQQAIRTLAPTMKSMETIGEKEDVVYKLSDGSGNIIGYAFLAEGQGYQGKIKMLSVISPNLVKLEGIEVLESVETPGLGAKIQGMPFRKQFMNLAIDPQIVCTKEEVSSPNQIKAITGATVSSKAVVNILNKRITKLKEQIKQ